VDPRTAAADCDRCLGPEQPAAVVSSLVSDNAGLISGAAIPDYGHG
jgi:hypothetical protein